MADYNDNKWHFDKRVPLALIAAIALQAVFFAVFLVGLDYRLKALEEKAGEQHSLPTDIAVMKTEIAGIKEDLSENKHQLGRIEDKIDDLKEPD